MKINLIIIKYFTILFKNFSFLTHCPFIRRFSIQPIKNGGPWGKSLKFEMVPPTYVVGKLVCVGLAPSFKLIG